jgi:hypothetical protein
LTRRREAATASDDKADAVAEPSLLIISEGLRVDAAPAQVVVRRTTSSEARATSPLD